MPTLTVTSMPTTTLMMSTTDSISFVPSTL
jgi:hypothetical protein